MDDRKRELDQLKEEYQGIPIPDQALPRVMLGMDRGKIEKKRQKRRRLLRYGSMAAAVVLGICMLPNTSPSMARAMGELPLVGGLFRVVTVREFQYEDEGRQARIEQARISVEGEELAAAEAVNLDMEKTVNDLIRQFEESLTEKGYLEVSVTSQVVTDSERWFTLRVEMNEIQASGYTHYKYYTIDKMTGEQVNLAGLFASGEKALSLLQKDIIEQMEKRMEQDENVSYFPEELQALDEDQNFYFNEKNELVIVFDEYQVAPGYMGTPEFVISEETVESLK